MIETIINNIMEENSYTGSILEIFPTGSQMFKYGDVNDLDYIVILDFFEEKHMRIKKEVNNNQYDVLFLDAQAVRDRMDFKYNTAKERNYLLFNYFYAIRETLHGEKFYDIDILANKDKYLFVLKHRYDNTLNRAIVKRNFAKNFVHYYIVLKIFENNKVEINNDMLIFINRLYSFDDDAINHVIEMIESIPQIDLPSPGEE
jgi:hypothetical protein